jgi:hypothetical protein
MNKIQGPLELLAGAYIGTLERHVWQRVAADNSGETPHESAKSGLGGHSP